MPSRLSILVWTTSQRLRKSLIAQILHLPSWSNSNGKIDKRVLKAMAEEKIARGESAMHTPSPANVKPAVQPMPLPVPASLRPTAPQGLVFAPLTKRRDFMSPAQAIHNLSAPLQEIMVAPVHIDATYPAEKMPADSMIPMAAPPMTRRSSSSGSSATDIASMKDKAEHISDVEKANWWDGYLDDELPTKTQNPKVRNIRHQIFSLYRRLFGVVFVSNLALFIATVAKQHYSALYLGKIVVANLFCAILMRQEYVVNAFFAVFCAVPSSWPLIIRRICARVYHIGGCKLSSHSCHLTCSSILFSAFGSWSVWNALDYFAGSKSYHRGADWTGIGPHRCLHLPHSRGTRLDRRPCLPHFPYPVP
jgi:hypothetical protein